MKRNEYKKPDTEESFGIWQLSMLILSIVTLVMLTAQTFLMIDERLLDIFLIAVSIICCFFFADFLLHIRYSRPLKSYLKWGWLDLLSCIPLLPIFRIASIARIVRILRVLKAARASKHILYFILIHRSRNTFVAVVFGSFVLLLFSAMAIVTIEPNMKAADAFWWCFFALFKGELGSYYPSSVEGRIITALLITAGVALFGTFTASVASFFLEEEQEEEERRDADILREIEQLKQQIIELRDEIRKMAEK